MPKTPTRGSPSPAPNHTIATAAYIVLAEHVGNKERDGHGWQTRAAEKLGITKQHLSKILSGEKQVGRELIKRASDRVGISERFFSDENPRETLVSRTELRQAKGHPLIFLVEEAQRILAALAAGQAPSDAELAGFIDNASDNYVSRAASRAARAESVAEGAAGLASAIVGEAIRLKRMYEESADTEEALRTIESRRR